MALNLFGCCRRHREYRRKFGTFPYTMFGNGIDDIRPGGDTNASVNENRAVCKNRRSFTFEGPCDSRFYVSNIPQKKRSDPCPSRVLHRTVDTYVNSASARCLPFVVVEFVSIVHELPNAFLNNIRIRKKVGPIERK